MKYVMKVLIGIDQFGNTLMGGAPDETISARAGRNKGKPGFWNKVWWTPLAWTLNKIEPDHVEKAILSEETGKQQDPAYKDVYDPDDTSAVK